MATQDPAQNQTILPQTGGTAPAQASQPVAQSATDAWWNSLQPGQQQTITDNMKSNSGDRLSIGKFFGFTSSDLGQKAIQSNNNNGTSTQKIGLPVGNQSTNISNPITQISNPNYNADVTKGYSYQNGIYTPNTSTTTPPVDPVAQKFQQTLSTLQGGKTQPPSTPGVASAAVAGATPPPTPTDSGTSPAVQNFYQNNDNAQKTSQQLQDYLSPETTRTAITNAITQLGTDKTALAGLNLQHVNMQNLMSGTRDAVIQEINHAGGFATENQIQALTAARNKGWLETDKNITDSIANMQAAISNDTSLLASDRQEANTEFTQRMDIMNFQKAGQQMAQSTLDTMQKTEGWDGILAATQASGDPNAVQTINNAMGNGFDLATMAKQDATARANAAAKTANDLAAQTETRKVQESTIAKNNADIAKIDSTLGKNASAYDVNSGDTFESIANKLGSTPEAIQAANPNINANNLQPGQTLNLPPKSQVGKTTTTKLPTTAQVTQKINTSISDPRFKAMTSQQKADFIHKMGGDPTKFHY